MNATKHGLVSSIHGGSSRLSLSVIMLFSFWFAGCAIVDLATVPPRIHEEKKDWADANAADTRIAYEAYLKKYPKMQWRAERNWPTSESIDHRRTAEIRAIWVSAMENNLVTRPTYDDLKRYSAAIISNAGKDHSNLKNRLVENASSCGRGAIEPCVLTLGIFPGVDEKLQESVLDILASIRELESLEALITLNRQRRDLIRSRYKRGSYEASDVGIKQNWVYTGPYRAALITLTELLGAPAEKRLLQLGSENDQYMRGLAAKGLAQFQTESARSFFVEALKTKDLEIISEGVSWYVKAAVKGSEETIIEALNTHGTTGMGYDLLNCGNSKLEAAAAAMFVRSGYRIQYFPGPRSGLKWGGGN